MTTTSERSLSWSWLFSRRWRLGALLMLSWVIVAACRWWQTFCSFENWVCFCWLLGRSWRFHRYLWSMRCSNSPPLCEKCIDLWKHWILLRICYTQKSRCLRTWSIIVRHFQHEMSFPDSRWQGLIWCFYKSWLESSCPLRSSEPKIEAAVCCSFEKLKLSADPQACWCHWGSHQFSWGRWKANKLWE